MNQCKSCGGFCGKTGCERRDSIVPCKHFRSGITNKTAADCPYCRIDELEDALATQPSQAGELSEAVSATCSFFNNGFGQSIPTVLVSFQPNDWASRDAFSATIIAAINAKESK